MSKTKEQCMHLISEKFDTIEEQFGFSLHLNRLEEMIIEIGGSEYGFLYRYDKSTNSLTHFIENKKITTILEPSIVQEVLSSKKGFFDNHVIGSKHFNPSMDNPLGIQLKSLLVTPILNKTNEDVIGCLVSLNSVDSPHEFKRYDVRCLGFLNASALITLSLIEEKSFVKKTTQKENNKVEKNDKSMLQLHLKIEEQKQKIEQLESELKLEKVSESRELVVLDNKYQKESTELNTILEFLTNEVSYLANDEHKIYLFLEIIKNSLHNKEQLHFVNNMLEKSQLIPNLANELYTRKKMPLLLEKFNPFQLIDDLANMYGKRFSEKEVTFNLFLNPVTPSYLISEMLKIKSIIIHLLNNIYGLTQEQGAVELYIKYENQILNIELKNINPVEKRNIQNFFQAPTINQSLTSSDSGLGLSVSSNLINTLGGKLKLSKFDNDNYSFMVSIPVEIAPDQRAKYFIPNRVIKIVIFLSDENRDSSRNLLHYFRHLGIHKKDIKFTSNSKELRGDKSTYLFCFENMLSKITTSADFSAVVILKYTTKEIGESLLYGDNIYQIYVNSYYGVELQKLFYPKIESEKLLKRTLLMEDTFLNKFNSMVKKLKLM